MVDPLTPAVSGAASKAGGMLVARAAEWLKGDEFDRLFAAVAERVAPDVGISMLAPVRTDPTVIELVAAFLEDPDSWDQQAFVDAIEPLVGALDDEGSPRATAETVAELIRESAWQAFPKDREALVHTVRSEVGSLTRLAAPRFLSEEWVPRQALEAVRRLSRDHPEEAAHLEDALADEARRRRALANLVQKPQRWLREGSSAVWATVADLALAHGLLEVAEQALVEASERSDADRVRHLSRAAQVAHLRGDTERADVLLEEAQSLDPEHPAVAIARARRSDDASERLELLKGVEPQDDLQAAAIAADRALAFLSLGNYAEARRQRDLAVTAHTDSPNVRELSAVISLIENADRTPDTEVDVPALTEAGNEFLSLREELVALGRYREAAWMLARASEAFSLAGDRRRARAAIEAILDEERREADEGGLRQLASASLLADLPTTARELLAPAEPSDDEGRLLLAQALLATERDPSPALAILDEVITGSSDPHRRAEAGRLRLLAATAVEGVSSSDEALAALEAVDPTLARMFEADELKRHDKYAEAETLLLPHQQDSRALLMLVELARARKDWKTALQLQRTLRARGATPEKRMLEAQLLEESGDIAGALTALASLRADSRVPRDIRASAYARSASLLYSARKFSEVVEVVRAWRAFMPDDEDVGWALVRGLTRLARWEEALAVLDGRHELDRQSPQPLRPYDEEDAVLAATVFMNALPPAEAIPRIASLSDHFNRSVEALEALIVIAGVGADGLPADVAERRALSFREFPERFPDSQAIRAFEAPTTAEEFEEFAREHAAPRASTGAELYEQVVHGNAPVALLAGALGKPSAEVWAGLEPLPIGYGDPGLDQLELADALNAVGKPAVWDTSSLYIVGGLGPDIASAAMNFLPASVIAQATLDDVAASAGGLTADADGDLTLLSWDVRLGRPRVTVIPREEVDRQTRALRGMFELASSLRAVENVDLLSAGRLDHLASWAADEPVPPAFLAWPATFAVAARLDLPVFSDDRYLRVQARSSGLRSFGTCALLDVLVQLGHLEPAIRDWCRRRLRLSFAMGLVPPVDVLLEEARAAGWGLDHLVGRALLDPTGWRDIDDGFRSRIPFLQAALKEAGTGFSIWVLRVLEAAHSVHPRVPLDDLAAVLLAHAWITDDPHFARAVTAVIRDYRLVAGMRTDPILRTFQVLMEFFRNTPARPLVVRRAMQAVGRDEQLAFLDFFSESRAATSR